MEISLTKSQVDKIFATIQIVEDAKNRISAIEKEINSANKTQKDIVETIFECNNVNVNSITNIKLENGKLVFDVIEPALEASPISIAE